MDARETLTLAKQPTAGERSEITKRTEDRPSTTETRKEAVPPKRIPLSGNHRDILSVRNTNPNFHYRWVADESVDGHNIYRYKAAGYDFAPREEDGRVLSIGLGNVWKPKPNAKGGGVVRVPASKNKAEGFLYLMRIKQEWYEEDQAREQAQIDDRARRIHTKSIDESDASSFYGGVQIGGMTND